MFNKLNSAQKYLLGGILPIAIIIILFALPYRDWTSRLPYFAILIASILFVYGEALIFGKESSMVIWGKKFLIGFPLLATIVASTITLEPYIHTKPGYWSPPKPREPSGLSDVWQSKKYTHIWTIDETCITEEQLGKLTASGGTCNSQKLFLETYHKKANDNLAKKESESISHREHLTVEYSEAIKAWEQNKQYYSSKSSIRYHHQLIDSKTALYWLILLVIIGGVEFRLLSLKLNKNPVITPKGKMPH